MATLSLYRNPQHELFVIANFGNHGQTFRVGAQNQVSLISYTPANLEHLSTESFHIATFTHKALFYAKHTILMQEDSIRKIATRFGLEFPEGTTEFTKLFAAWVRENQKRITELDLSGLDLATIPPQIRYFSKLISLNISNNNLRRLPPELIGLKTIVTLDISNNPLESVPDLSVLDAMKELRTNGICLGQVPDWLQTMDLQRIELKNNLFTSLPEWWDEWAQKKEVEIDAWNLL